VRPVLAMTCFVTMVTCASAVARGQDSTAYARVSSGTRWLESDGGLSIKVLVEAGVFGGSNVEIAEATLPVGYGSGPASHRHGSAELIYLLSGELEHIVNGESHRLTPGMIGIVKPPDNVVHRVIGPEPVKALLIWAPGGEVDRLARVLRQRPVRQP